MDALTAALKGTIKIEYTWSDDVSNYVSSLLGDELDYTIHESYVSFQHPLTKKLVKLSTHKNSVRSAPARVRNATANLTKIEEEIDERNASRIDQLIELTTLEIEKRIYADYTGEEELVAEQQSTIKVDMQDEKRRLKKKARKAEKKALKQKERELQQKVGSKRRAAHVETSDDSSDEETEEDRSFIAPEGRPRKQPRAAASNEITVNVRSLDGEVRPFDAQLHAPARALRMHIAECMEGVQSDQIRLIYRGRPLNDDLTLHQNEVADGARVHLVMAMEGGGSKRKAKEDAMTDAIAAARARIAQRNAEIDRLQRRIEVLEEVRAEHEESEHEAEDVEPRPFGLPPYRPSPQASFSAPSFFSSS